MGEPQKKVEPPGWNDPPMLNYSATNPPVKSRIQNKRIGFSFNSSASVNGNTSGSTPLPPSAPLPSSIRLPPSAPALCSPELYKKGKENFDKILVRLADDQMRKTIENLLEMWQSGGLTADSQQCLCELSTSLVENDIVKSNQLHFKLCMNTSPQTASYWQAVKNLIIAVSNDV